MLFHFVDISYLFSIPSSHGPDGSLHPCLPFWMGSAGKEDMKMNVCELRLFC